MKENALMKQQLLLMMKKEMCNHGSSSGFENLQLSSVMKMLLDCAKTNAGRKNRGFRYDSALKEFGTLLFTLNGPMNYKILCKNLPLPSVSNARRNLLSNETIIEGQFRFQELKQFLIKRNLPLKVWISEDGTRVTGRVQYDVKTNQIVGFVPPLDENGIPVVKSFPATSAAQIKSYYDTGVVSSNAYVIMAQPLSPDSSAFCLAIYGTDNRFQSSHVLKRWHWMVNKAKEENIEIIGFSSDGDTKLLKSMYSRTFRNPSSEKWPWFSSHLNSSEVTIQDSIHLLVKLKSKLLKASDILPMGKKDIASRGHIIELINAVSKDQHEIAMSFIDVKDKMNFRSAQKLCDEKVTKLLRSSIPGSEATATFLDMMRQITSAYLDPLLEPFQRISLLWEWTFFVRFWRKWITKTDGYTLGHNFITSNAYTCLEINAHGIIKAIQKFRDSEQPELFLPWLFDSQPSEIFFRAGRSMTSTFSTVINFSILEFTHRIRRIDFIGESMQNLKDTVNFPKFQKTFRFSQDKPESHSHILPEDYEIEQAVADAFKRALKRCVKFGIAKPNSKYPRFPLASADEISESCDVGEADDCDEELALEEDLSGTTQDDDGDEASEDLMDAAEDLLMVSTGSLGLRCFKDAPLNPTSPFVEVLDGHGNPCIIKKTSLCWLLNSGDTKMSSDRLVRVQSSLVSHSKCSNLSPANAKAPKPFKEENVSVGDWCALRSEDESVIIGRILAFSYLSGSTWRNQEYSAISAPVTAPKSQGKRGIGCMCNWYQIGKHGRLQSVSMDIHGYYNIDYYICSIPRPKTIATNLVTTCSINDILSLK